MAVVGIDLGTTNTVVAAVRDGRAAAIKDKLGRALLPSVVSFPPRGEPKVGHEAKARRTLDPENTVFSIKRLIGRSWESEHVTKARNRFPFELKEGPGKGTLVQCQGKDYTLPEISAMVLTAAREIAEQRLVEQVTGAVITVPANFNDLQRAATKVAGRVAGLEVLRIVNEPTAAALAYGFGKRERERIAVYDFGGGTFDVTLLDLNENVFEVLSTAGDTFLGGDDLDEEIVTRMGEDLLKKHKVDMEQDNLVVEQLRAAAERLKIDLSTRSMGRIEVKEIGYVAGRPIDFEFTLRRADFEKMVEPYLERTLEVCQEALDIAGIATKELDQVLLVGGSTRIPLVRRRISSFFGRMPQSRINPDEVVAIGAAIQASALETKLATEQLPSAPIPTSLRPESRAPGTTKLGLAGPPPTSTGTPAPQFPRQPGKTLSGVGTQDSASFGPTPASAGERTGPQTLSGLGAPPSQEVSPLLRGHPPKLQPTDPAHEDPTVRLRPGQAAIPPAAVPPAAGPRGAALPRSAQAGAASPPARPRSEEAPDSEDELPTGKFHQSSFDDITSVLKRPDQVARLQDRRAELSETLLGPGGSPLPSGGPPSGAEGSPRTEEGSVTFDLEELEAQAKVAERQAATAEPRADTDLPAVVRRRLDEIEEVSGVLEMPEDEGEEADLPDVSRHPLADLPVAKRSSLPPALTADLPVVSAGLPTTRADLPARAETGLPAPRDDSIGLPILSKKQLSSPPAPLPPEELFDETDPLDETGILGSLPPPDPRQPLESVAESEPPYRSTLGSIDESIEEVLSAPPGSHSSSPWTGRSSDPVRYPSSAPVSPSARPPLLIDVTPLALGVETVGGFVETMIERNSPVPCQRAHIFTTVRDQQTVVRVRVSQGQGNRFIDNTLLGEVELRGLQPGPRGSVRVAVTFALDESGMLQVSARDQATGQAADARLKLVGLEDARAR